MTFPSEPPPASPLRAGGRGLPELAAILDAATREGGPYRIARAVRETLSLPLGGDLPDGQPVGERALVWAVNYHVETVDAQRRRRIRLAPARESGDDRYPPAVPQVDEQTVAVWRGLSELVTAPAAQARLHHLMFERRGPGADQDAAAAVEAYLQAAQRTPRAMDAVADLVAATRLARAVHRTELTATSLAATAELVARLLAEPDPPYGPVLTALQHLVDEPDPPAVIDALLERALAAWPDLNRVDRLLAVQLQRCGTDADRAGVWRRRVELFTAAADAATSKIMRATRLQQALQRAERSQVPELRRETAALLQTVRHDELEMMTFTATSRRYDEEFAELLDHVIAGDDWRAALISFTLCGPLSGDPERNRALIRDRQQAFPLGQYLPVELLGPDRLPAYQGTSEEDRFDVDLTQWEAELIRQWARVLGPALHELPARHGLPTLTELVGFLVQWPGTDQRLALALGCALLRFWTGDNEGAAFTIVSRIEAIARELAVATERGLYRLQHEQAPGQYPGLGTLLPILHDEGIIDEAHLRFLSALLCHPAGLNLRNHMLHGFIGDVAGSYTAVLLQAAFYLASRGSST